VLYLKKDFKNISIIWSAKSSLKIIVFLLF
jgi:hypothetical protein